MTNQERYKKTFDALASSERVCLEVEEMRKQIKKRRGLSRASAVVIALLCLAGLSGAAYAAGKYFGIFDFSNRSREKIPVEAIGLIDTTIEQNAVEETDETIINCTVKEALCDSETIRIVYEVSAKEKGKFLFIPEDGLPEDNMSNWSDVSSKTAEEYAKEKGLELVNIGGGIVNRDELGIIASTLDFWSGGDDVMYIYVRSQKESSAKAVNVTCMATALIHTENPTVEDVMRKTITFTLEDLSDTIRKTYIPLPDTAANSEYEIKRAEVIQTELGTYVDVFYTGEHKDYVGEGLSFRLLDSDGQIFESIGGSGIERQEDGTYKERRILNKQELGSRLTVEVYDVYEGTMYGRTELEESE